MSDSNTRSLSDAVLHLAATSAGRPFPADAIADLGGWTRIATDAAELAGQPALPLVAHLIARDAEPGNADAAAAAEAVATAVLVTESPVLRRDSLEALLTSAIAVQAAGASLAAGLESIAAAFLTRKDREPKADLASADALEVLTRLVAAGHGSRFALMGLLEKFTAPTEKPMARAVLRSVSTSLDLWPEAESLVAVVRALGGLDPVAGADLDLAADVEDDACWVLAMASLLLALRAPTVQEMGPHLDQAAKYFGVAATTHGRQDAAPMVSVVNGLRALVTGVVASDPMGAMKSEALAPNVLDHMRDQVLRFAIDSSGLDHWYSDSKRVTLIAWAGLATSLEHMGKHLGKDGFYQAEVVVADLLNIYVSSRTFRVGTHGAPALGIDDLVQPVIEGGFASNASHMSNLEEYAADLEARENLAAQDTENLTAARALIEAARRVAKGSDASGKSDGGVPSTPLPPLLGQLVPPGSPDEGLLDQLSPTTLAAIAERMDHVAAGKRRLNIAQQELLDELRTALADSPDYKGDVVAAVDEILVLTINFVASRTGASAGHYKYLFNASAKEGDIHEDLYNYLVGNLGHLVEYEVQHVGGGRVDLRLKYSGFAVHIELKDDSTRMAMSDRTAYLKQAATYQGNDIRIGFLVALRHKAFDPTGPPPHIKTLIGHTAFDIDGDPVPRHIITVAVPGDRTNPSNSK